MGDCPLINKQRVLSNQPFLFYWIARTISTFGDSLAVVTLVLYVYHDNGSAVAVGIVLTAQVIPSLFGPVLAPLANRVEQRLLLITSDIFQTAAFVIIALIHPSFLWLIITVVLTSLFATLSSAVRGSVLPLFVESRDLMKANALLRSGASFSAIFGPAMAGILVAASGPSIALLIDAATFFVSALLIFRLPPLKMDAPVGEIGYLREGAIGLRFVSRHVVTRTLLLVMFVYVVFAAFDNVALIFLTHSFLHTGDAGYGLLISVYSVGMVIGSLSVLRLRRRVTPPRILLSGLLQFGLGTLFTGLAPVLIFAAVFQFIAAFGNALENVATDTVIQLAVPQEMLASAFSAIYGVMQLASGIAYVSGAPLIHLLTARGLFVCSGIIVLAIVLLGARPLLMAGRGMDYSDSKSMCYTYGKR